MNFKIFAVLCYFLVNYGSCLRLPQTFGRCKVAPDLDNKPNECLRNAVDSAIKLLSISGSKELGAIDLDPMKIDRVLIEKGDTSPVAVTLDFKNNDMIGMGNMKVDEVNGKLSSPKDFDMVIKASADQMQLTGPYTVGGKVLVLPIQGDGISNLTMANVKTVTTIKGEPMIKNGKEFLKIKSLKLAITTDRLYTNLGNLFNGDKALGDNMNRFLNDNWQDIFNELKASVEGAFSAIFEEYARRIMERIQFKNIFIVD